MDNPRSRTSTGGGTATFRIKMRPGTNGKQYPWVQRRLLGILWWRWWYPVRNRLHSLQHEAIDYHIQIQELILLIKDAEKDEKNAVRMVDEHNPDKGISSSWRDIARKREPEIPKATDEYKDVLRLYESHKRRGPTGGQRTAYIPEGMTLPNREKTGEPGYDTVINYKAPRPQPQSKNQKGGGNQRGNQNQGNQGNQHKR